MLTITNRKKHTLVTQRARLKCDIKPHGLVRSGTQNTNILSNNEPSRTETVVLQPLRLQRHINPPVTLGRPNKYECTDLYIYHDTIYWAT